MNKVTINPKHREEAIAAIRKSAEGMACDLIDNRGVLPTDAILTVLQAMTMVISENVIEAANAFQVEISDAQKKAILDRLYLAVLKELRLHAIGDISRRWN